MNLISPIFRWFSGAQTNVAYNALDLHVKEGWGAPVPVSTLWAKAPGRLARWWLG